MNNNYKVNLEETVFIRYVIYTFYLYHFHNFIYKKSIKGELDNVEFHQHPIFGLFMPKYCPNVPIEILDPMNTWLQKGAYIGKAINLAHSFHLNFEKFANQASEQIMEGGPLIDEHHKLGDHV